LPGPVLSGRHRSAPVVRATGVQRPPAGTSRPSAEPPGSRSPPARPRRRPGTPTAVPGPDEQARHADAVRAPLRAARSTPR
jgi:hypothetical protein